MKRITVISGKGGTGKTTIVSNLAGLAKNIVIADCDVDAPNLHLLLEPNIIEVNVFKGGKIAVKNESLCSNCGTCYQVCRFGAVSAEGYKINPLKCDGCNVCVTMCPNDALKLKEKETGAIYRSKSDFGPMIHAQLNPGGDNSGKLVSEVRREADKAARAKGKEIILIDGSPGIGCPVIASLNGVDAALIVTEPTKSGLSDLNRVLAVTEHFGIRTFVIINKYDLNKKLTQQIEEFCYEKKIEIIGKIAFDPEIIEALHKGQLMIQYSQKSNTVQQIKEIWQKISELVLF